MPDPNHAVHAALDQQSARVDEQSRRIEELETRLRTLCDSLEERAALIDGRSAEGRQLAIALREAREVLK